MYKTIVVGAHKSETARRAVDAAIELAGVLGANLHLVGAYPKDSGRVGGEDTPGRVETERSVAAMVPVTRLRRSTTHVMPGDPAKAILQVASEVGADLIVVGNKRMHGAGRLLGSVPNDVAHHAHCAVLIVRTT